MMQCQLQAAAGEGGGEGDEDQCCQEHTAAHLAGVGGLPPGGGQFSASKLLPFLILFLNIVLLLLPVRPLNIVHIIILLCYAFSLTSLHLSFT